MRLPAAFPPLASLDLFVTVVSLGSLSQAANAHGLSQPAASSRISKLERQVGLQLLERSPRGTQPTAAGRLVANWANAVLSASEDLWAGVESLSSRSVGRLRVAASYTVAEHVLPKWLGRLRAAHRSMQVELDVANSAGVLERLRRHQVDVGFVESSGSFPGVSTAVVGADELLVVVAPGHEWSRRESISAQELSQVPLVLRERGSGTREALEEAMSSAGVGLPIPGLEFGSSAAVVNAVAEGELPSVLSGLAVGRELTAGRLCSVPVRDLDLRRELRAVWLNSSSVPEAAWRLIRLILHDETFAPLG